MLFQVVVFRFCSNLEVLYISACEQLYGVTILAMERINSIRHLIADLRH